MRNITLATLAIIMLITSGCSSLTPKVKTGQHAYSMDKEVKVTAKLNYLMYTPKGYPEAQKEWPLMLFLHGGGEKGDDLELVKRNGPPMLAEKKDFPFIIVSPQCPANSSWNSHKQIMAIGALLDDLIKNLPVDEDRVYLTGISMGGYGTWAVAPAFPEKFAAIVPICGGGRARDTRKLINIPTWVFHGAKDKVISIDKSKEMVNALKKYGGKEVKFTIYPETGHNSWVEAYESPELYKWILSKKRTK